MKPLIPALGAGVVGFLGYAAYDKMHVNSQRAAGVAPSANAIQRYTPQPLKGQEAAVLGLVGFAAVMLVMRFK